MINCQENCLEKALPSNKRPARVKKNKKAAGRLTRGCTVSKKQFKEDHTSKLVICLIFGIFGFPVYSKSIDSRLLESVYFIGN